MEEIKNLLEKDYFKLDGHSMYLIEEETGYFYTLIKDGIKVYLTGYFNDENILCTLFKNDEIIFNDEGELLYIIGLIKPFL